MNSSVKESYKETFATDSSKLRVSFYFGIVDKYEEKLNKDICDFTIDETTEMYKELSKSFTNNSLYVMNNRLANYAEWCRNNHLTENRNPYLNFGTDFFYGLENGLISELEMLSIKNKMENPSSKVMIACPFYGFTNTNEYEDFMKLTKDDVDTDTGMIHLHNREIKIPKSICYDILESFDTYEYSTKLKTHNLIGNGVIKFGKDISNPDYNISNVLYLKYNREISDRAGRHISYKMLRESGIFNFLTKIAAKHDTSNLKEIINTDEAQAEVFDRFAIKNNSKTKSKLVVRYQQYIQ